ncbi:MAG: peptidylprolyl isomerase [Proteobacteria bacterium]|nr:peptidylprolyl isomerase [Pseudomonadota bacterium]
MKKLLLSLTAIVASLLIHAPAFAAVQEGIAAVVNDSVITVTDIKERADLYMSANVQSTTPAQRKEVERQVLSRLIDEALQLQEAQKLGINVSDADIAAGLADIAKQNNSSPEEFKKRLEQKGASIRSLSNQVKANIAWVQVVRRKLRPQVDVSESEIDLALNQIASGKGKAQYHVAEIFLKAPDPAKESDTQDEVGKMVRQINDGASFSSIAHEFSQAPGATNGGDLGWVQEGQLDPELDKALSAMHPGEVSAPIRSATGYHILFLKELRQSSAHESTMVPTADKGPIISMKQIFIPITNKESKPAVAAKIARGSSLKKELTSCDAMTEKMKSFPSSDTGDLGKGLQNGLPQEVRAVVENLKIGELSDPIRTPTGVALLMVCSREGAPPALAEEGDASTLESAATKDEAAREQVANKLGMKRLDQMASHYLNDLRATAFIDKRL